MMSYQYFSWVSILIFFPIISGITLIMTGHLISAYLSKLSAMISALIMLFISIIMYMLFDIHTSSMQFVECTKWIPTLNVEYYVGLDGISLLFIFLTLFTTLIAICSTNIVLISDIHKYLGSFLILSGLTVGTFSALDGMLFYIFFEATLIPMYLIIGRWGGDNRIYASTKFFLYTLVGSILALVAFIYLWYISDKSFDILTWHALRFPYIDQIFIFLALFFAFAIKIPMFPLHTWLPTVHVEAPTSGSIILAAIMLKLGAYGFLRFSLPILPDACHVFSNFMICLSLISIIYISFIAIVQDDMKALIAYSSIAHMGFVTLGIFIGNKTGLTGSIFQMLSHGFISSGMFLCIGALYERSHSRLINDHSGLAKSMPKLAVMLVFFSMANIGLPGTSGFVGELMIILAATKYSMPIGLLAASNLLLSAAYMLFLIKRIIFGKIKHYQMYQDLSKSEFFSLATIAIVILIIGLYPSIITNMTEQVISTLLNNIDMKVQL